MYNEEHYMSKLDRNLNLIEKAPEELKHEMLTTIRWAKDLISRLDNLDYNEREQAIASIHKFLDEDYNRMLNTRGTRKF